jgi:hypothetical protein
MASLMSRSTGIAGRADQLHVHQRAASHTITASFRVAAVHDIHQRGAAGGTISPAGPVSVTCGANTAFAIAPSSCYTLANVAVDGASVGPQSGYTFTNVRANHTIAATFSIVQYVVSASAAAAARSRPLARSVSTAAPQPAFTMTPAACYGVANVVVDGVSRGALASYTFTNVQASHTIAASFAFSQYVISATAGAGGTITPSGPLTVGLRAERVVRADASRLLHDCRRRRRRRVARSGCGLHVHERAGEPHDRGVVLAAAIRDLGQCGHGGHDLPVRDP